LLSVWASGPDNAWVVGGEANNAGPVIEHYDGTGWTKLSSGLAGNVDLWWVTGFDDGHVFVSGSQGSIAQTTDGSSFTVMTTPPGNVTVFGMWGSSSSDVWAVGGTGAGGAFIWRYNGTAWTVYPSLPIDITTCWKVNGAAADNVWISCTNGTTLHWDGSSLQRMDIADAADQQASLFSIGVNSKRAITVGGSITGVLYENAGSGWQAAISNIGVLLSGVAVSETDAYAVGGGGTIVHRSSAGTWSPETSGTTEGLHSVFIDPTGDVWSVGGNFNQTPTINGVLLHKGHALEGSFE